MRGIRLDINGPVPVLDTETPQEGLKATLQNHIVNFLTIPGSDKVYADRGTELARPGALVIGFDSNLAQHECNFAVLDILTFAEASEVRAGEYRTKETVPQLYCYVDSVQSGKITLRLTNIDETSTFSVSAI